MLTMTKMGFFAAHYITKRLGNPAFLFNLASTAVPTRPSTWPAATWPLWAYQSGFFGGKTTKSSPSKKGGLIRRAGLPRRQNRPHSITAWLALVNTPPASWALPRPALFRPRSTPKAGISANLFHERNLGRWESPACPLRPYARAAHARARAAHGGRGGPRERVQTKTCSPPH